MQNRFKELRLERDLSLRDLGEKIGLNYSTIACYETRKREPNIGFFFYIGRIIDIKIKM